MAGPTASTHQATPVAFLSYAHHDDRTGRLTKLRDQLRAELQSQTGEPFDIFKDSDNIGLGENWRRRLEEGLADATLLLPIVTPSFLKSEYCRDELETFRRHERELGRDDLVLPIYFIDCSEFLDGRDEAAAKTLAVLLERQYHDWRYIRDRPYSDRKVKQQLAHLATGIRRATARAGALQVRSRAGTPRREQGRPKSEAPTYASMEILLDALFDRDPVISRAAARAAAELGPDVIPSVVERLTGLAEPTVFVLRELLAAFPEESGPLMVERIKSADRNWRTAASVPQCLSLMHRPVCEAELSALFGVATVEQDRDEADGHRRLGLLRLGGLGLEDRRTHSRGQRRPL